MFPTPGTKVHTRPNIIVVPSFSIYTSSQTLVIPKRSTSAKIWLVGAGGGGGGVGTTVGSLGGFGSGGATLFKYLTNLTPGATLILTIGALGTGGAAGANPGTAGSNSTLVSGTQVISSLTAFGGAGGPGDNSGVGAANGALTAVATGGDLNLPSRFILNSVSGGGNAVSGDSYFGWGVFTTTSGASNINGNNGNGFGAGGGGAFEGAGGVAKAGGNGTSGVAFIDWLP